MSADNVKIEKKKIALTEETYEKLKIFSRLNGLKLRIVVDSMVEITLKDEELSKRIIEMSSEKESKESAEN